MKNTIWLIALALAASSFAACSKDKKSAAGADAAVIDSGTTDSGSSPGKSMTIFGPNTRPATLSPHATPQGPGSWISAAALATEPLT